MSGYDIDTASLFEYTDEQYLPTIPKNLMVQRVKACMHAAGSTYKD